MPKVGRKPQAGVEFDTEAFSGDMASANAPFGTDVTPKVRLKIVGGKAIPVVDNAEYLTPRPGDFYQSQGAVSPRGQVLQASNVTARSPSPLKLTSLTEKPNNFQAQEYAKRIHHGSAPFPYRSRIMDFHGNSKYTNPQPLPPQQNTDLSQTSSPFNPHKLIPPIGTPQERNAYPSNNSVPIISQNQTVNQNDSDAYLPRNPISLPKREELELQKQIHKDLQGFNGKKFKDIYLELTGFDQRLSGYVSYQDLGFTLLKSQVNISPTNLRLAASMFVSQEEGGKINYEKVLSFLSACLNKPQDLPMSPRRDVPPGVPPNLPDTNNNSNPLDPRNGNYYNPLTHTAEDYSSSSQKYPFGERDNAKLLRMIEQNLLDSGDELNFEQIWSVFGRTDREHRGRLSREQIKTISYACRIPLQEALIDQIIDKCDNSNGQYNWEQYLKFIERVHPTKTGLNIPESKKPHEFVKHYPQPTENWPRTNVPARGEPPSQKAPHSHTQQGLDQSHGEPNVQSELRRLEEKYEQSKKELLIREQQVGKDKEPWFDRFMTMANAIYTVDTDSSGFLTMDEIKWLCHTYNTACRLELSPQDVDQAIGNCSDGNKVAINPLLKQLGVLGQ